MIELENGVEALEKKAVALIHNYSHRNVLVSQPRKLEVTLSDITKAALRRNPDIGIISAVCAEEAFYLLDAMGTGHEGKLTTSYREEGFIPTAHANSTCNISKRLPKMAARAKEERIIRLDPLEEYEQDKQDKLAREVNPLPDRQVQLIEAKV